ncbi:MAG: hypothetical protein CHACPFDD_02600 [Phycisphaerae bacterium]|nr:hypothetical protein [Phycisphaerae bacterium]
MSRTVRSAMTLGAACATLGLVALGVQERKVKQSEVPPAALTALQKLAGGAALTEFAEEIEHGHKYFEGSWKGPDGNVDGLVTETGDVVELEESVPADKVPAGVRAAAEKESGKDAKSAWERKTLYLYEVHFKKDGKGREMIFLADGRRFHEDEGNGKEGDKDDDKDDDDKDED